MDDFVDIPGTKGAYSCSKTGIIKSNKRWIVNQSVPQGGYYVQEKILKPCKNNKGYLYVDLMVDQKKKRTLVHRAVALTYIPNPENLPIINHKDFNPLNNNVDNLEWCSYSYNINYSAKQGRYSAVSEKKSKAIHVPKFYLYKTVDAYDLDGKFVRSFCSATEAGKFLVMIGAVSNPKSAQSNITSTCRGKSHTCGGYIWKYHREQK